MIYVPKKRLSRSPELIVLEDSSSTATNLCIVLPRSFVRSYWPPANRYRPLSNFRSTSLTTWRNTRYSSPITTLWRFLSPFECFRVFSWAFPPSFPNIWFSISWFDIRWRSRRRRPACGKRRLDELVPSFCMGKGKWRYSLRKERTWVKTMTKTIVWLLPSFLLLLLLLQYCLLTTTAPYILTVLWEASPAGFHLVNVF